MPKLNDKQAQQARDSEEFVLLDTGTYLACLNAVVAKQGDKGPYWEWEFLLTEDDDGNELERKPKLWENTSLSEQAIWRVNQMFEAFEVEPDTDTDDLLGCYVWVHVGQETVAQGSRAGQLRNCFLSAEPVPE